MTDNDIGVTKKRLRKDTILKVGFIIALAVTAFLLWLWPTRRMWAILFVEIGALLFTADIRKWVKGEVPQALDRMGSTLGIIMAVAALGFVLGGAPETPPPTPTPTPTPTATPTPNATPTPAPISVDTQRGQAAAAEKNPQYLTIHEEKSDSAFNGDVRVGVNAIRFGGEPLRHTVDATIRSPGRKHLSVKNFEVNTSVIYRGKAVYEISLVTVDTLWAKFEVRRVESENNTTPREGLRRINR